MILTRAMGISATGTFLISALTMEQYMMYCKAKLFGDENAVSEIMATDNVGRIKALGRAVKNYDETIWNGMRQVLIYRGLVEKFCQNPELKERLLSTDNDILAECAVQDRIWGIGLSMKDAKRFDLSQWNGQNLLGFTLMCVREQIKKEK